MIKRERYTLSLALALCVIVWGCSHDARETLTSPEGKFSITFPSGYPSAEKKTQNIPDNLSNVIMTTYLSETPEGACMISFCDYPKEAIAKMSIETILNNERDNAMKNTGGKLEKEEHYSIDGNQGRKIYFSGKHQELELYGQAVFLLVKNRIYQIVHLNNSKDAAEKPEILAFFNSFKLTK